MSSAFAFHARSLARNLLAGARLMFLLPLRGEAFRASPGQFVLLVLFNIVVWLAVAGVRSNFEGDFDPTSLSVYLANVAMTLAMAFLAAWAYRTPERLILFAIALSASDALFSLATLSFAAPALTDRQATLINVALVVWGWLASLRAAVVCGGWRWPGVALAWLAVTVMTAVALYVIPDADVWQQPDEDENPIETPIRLISL